MSDSYKLSDIYELQMGKTPSRDISDYWADGQYDWISIADLSKCEKYINQTKERITNRAIEESGIKVIPTDTIIMSFKLSIGKVAITQRPVYSNEAIMAFIDKGVTYILPQYAFYLFSAQKWDKGTNRAVMGATLNKATLSQYRVSIHNADEQAEIVNRLNKITDLINFRRKQIQKIDDLVKSQFIEMFGDPVKNPKCWMISRLSNHLEVIGGYAFKSDCFKNTGIPVLRIGNINSGAFQANNLVFWEYDKALEKYIMKPGDIVISLTGTVDKDDYANVCILGNDYERYYLNQRNAQLKLGASVNRLFIAQLLKFTEIKSRLTGISRGVRQANVANRDILNLAVPVPPIELQNEFARFVEQTDKSKNGYEMEAAA